jgi:diaminopimelate epimerase
MATIKFTKMEGAGNDYVYINLFEERVNDPQRLAVEMSHRHFGIGADGLILIAPSKVADIQMIMRNVDGSLSEMCGNAIRCVGKYAWDHDLVKKESLTIETGDGIKQLQLNIDANGNATSASVQMGIPELNAQKIPSTLDGESVIDFPFQFDGLTLNGTLVSMGNPHFVTFVDDVKKARVDKWGPQIETDSRFPNRINIAFVEIISPTEVKQRTWERGCGETWACGTAASAVCVAGVLNGKTESTILNHLTGGDLILTWKGNGQQVIMEGPAREVFTGVWETND